MQKITQESINEEIQAGHYSFILSHIPQNPAFSLSKRCFSQLNSSLSSAKSSPPELYCMALIYLIYLNQHSSNQELLITPGELASNLYILLEKLQGTLISSALLSHFRVFLKQALANLHIMSHDYKELLDTLNEQILGVRKALLFSLDTNKETEKSLEHLNMIAQKDRPLALMEYLDFMCSSYSLEEQFILISNHSHVFFENLLKPKSINTFFQETPINSLTSNPKDLFISLHKFLDTMIFQHRYPIIIPKGANYNEEFNVILINQQQIVNKNEDFTRVPLINNEEPKIVVFEDLQIKALLKKYPIYESFEPLLDFLLRNMVLSRENISQDMKLEFIKFMISVILDRLWDIYPQYQINMKLRLQAIFKEIDRENLHICQLLSGFLFHEKLKSKKRRSNDLLLRELLIENPQIKNSVESFQKDPHKYYKGPGVIKDLILKENCPLNQHILAGGYFVRTIEVFVPGTIIYWVFATRTLDIEFHIEFLGGFEANSEEKPIILTEKKRLETGKKVHRGLLLTSKPGLYRFCWDNGYSWFTEKFLRYRLYVLEPEENEDNEKSNHEIFNSCREMLGLDEESHPLSQNKENHWEEKDILKTNNKENINNNEGKFKGKVKETLENVYEWKKNVRVIVFLKEKCIEVKACEKEKGKLFELLREIEEFNEEIFKDSLNEVLHKISSLENEVKPEILFLKTREMPDFKIENVGFEYVSLDFNKVFMHGLLRKFIGVGGNLSNISRKPIPFSRILILSVIEGHLMMITFNHPERNLAHLLMNHEVSFYKEFKEAKKLHNEEKCREIALKCLINALFLLRFQIDKVIVNRNELFNEGFDREKLRGNVTKLGKDLMEIEELDVEALFMKNNLDFEVFGYEFKYELLLK